MKFQDYKYERIPYEAIEKDYPALIEDLKACTDPASFMEQFKKINTYRGHIMTMANLSSIRHSIDTSDTFYDAENEYWDETYPRIQVFETAFMKVCLDCTFRDQLDIPRVFFQLAEYSLKAFDERIIEDLQEENRLGTEYAKLKASARIEFEGEIYNLASIAPMKDDPDRAMRKRAYDAYNSFFEENEDKFDQIYDKLVKVRDRMAKKLGYETFTELGYIRMNRLDYNQEMVANYRRQVLQDIVPLVSKLHLRQAKRIGVEELKFYDSGYQFKSGNPKPDGSIDELVEAALAMYKEMSPETGEFFQMMVDCQLFDLPTRPNKEMGGYCNDLFDYKVPFIFSNSNGTQGDVDTLTHEAGHAFQSYLSQKRIDIPDICFPTMESAEIHSMSMEFFTHPWAENFFGPDADKYRFFHLADSLTFLPYGCLVDHFQHEVYNHPEMTPAERKATWRKLEQMYKPDISYDESPILDRGGYFYRQGHIFQNPFYYIDYTLAQVCALQFFARTLKKDPDAWADYVHLCTLGGTQSFLGLVKEAGLISPFVDGCLTDVAKTMEAELDSIDDTAL